ncbi:hypothetical protein QQS21_002614 [Conoideocrella luteorostrata]|uniref:Uncharacterized protein n=1 Tax=Conoideocrella luteorostrata TaxID=1105319 RepID=A0AAJ0G2V7_9HYPO|nr:hypothetical protein QQS21_002614 [Conoideocrella luteorostrata]
MAIIKTLGLLAIASFQAQALDATPINVFCENHEYNWVGARMDAVMNGIDHLRSVSGKPGSRAGPKMCGRVSCSYDSAIWWCNDNEHEIELRSYGLIADAAEAIRQKCYTLNTDGDWFTTGQAFMRGNWNVIVRRDVDNC